MTAANGRSLNPSWTRLAGTRLCRRNIDWFATVYVDKRVLYLSITSSTINDSSGDLFSVKVLTVHGQYRGGKIVDSSSPCNWVQLNSWLACILNERHQFSLEALTNTPESPSQSQICNAKSRVQVPSPKSQVSSPSNTILEPAVIRNPT
jgi:hypothetical protein